MRESYHITEQDRHVMEHLKQNRHVKSVKSCQPSGHYCREVTGSIATPPGWDATVVHRRLPPAFQVES